MSVWMKSLIGVLLFVCLAGCVSSAMYRERVETRYPAIGERIETGQARQHVIRQGEGQPVLMIHGASANAREYLITLAPELKNAPVELLMFDRTGHGYSERVADGNALGNQAEVIAEAYTKLSDDPGVVVGHSFGGAVARPPQGAGQDVDYGAFASLINDHLFGLLVKQKVAWAMHSRVQPCLRRQMGKSFSLVDQGGLFHKQILTP